MASLLESPGEAAVDGASSELAMGASNTVLKTGAYSELWMGASGLTLTGSDETAAAAAELFCVLTDLGWQMFNFFAAAFRFAVLSSTFAQNR